MKYLMKLSLVAALIAAVAFMGSSTTSFAQERDSYTSGIQFQNLESQAATLQLTAYKSDGSTDGTGQYNVAADGSITLFPLADVSTGFSGAIVLSSDRNGAAIANVLAADFSAGASYVGRSEGATEVQLPLLFKGNSGFNTWFSVQNAGSAAASITIDYSDGAPNVTDTIEVGAAKTYFQATENHTSAIFAATITSDQPIVAAVIQEDPSTMFAYTGFTGGTTNPLFPLINANNSGYQTGVQIQNAGDTATEVTLSYTPASDGTACTETATIQPGASETFALVAFNANNSAANTTCVAGEKFIGSAEVTANSANQDLVGITNQLLIGVNGEAYGSFSEDDATNVAVMPLIMDRRGGFFTGFNVQNVGTVASPVTCTFTDSSYTVSGTLQPGQALNDLQNGKIADNYAGSGTCTASASGAKLIAVVNELGSPTADNLLVYESSAK